MSCKNNLFVTGGLGALGRHVLDWFGKQEKFNVFSIDNNSNENFGDLNDDVKYLTCELSDYQMTHKLFKKINMNGSDFNILINMAGYIYNEPIIRLEDGEFKAHTSDGWSNTICSNLTTTFNSSVHFIKCLMENRKKGLIINASSVTSHGNPGQLSYSTVKSALTGFTNTIGREMGPYGIRCVALELGYIDVGSTKRAVSQSKLNTIRNTNPLKRLGNSNDVTQALQSIIDNDYLNATTLQLNGGQSV